MDSSNLRVFGTMFLASIISICACCFIGYILTEFITLCINLKIYSLDKNTIDKH